MYRRLHFAAVYLALAAMMLRAMIPAGWMPGVPVSGDGALVICTMQGPVQVAIGADGKPVPQHQQDSDANHAVCPFGAAGALSAPEPSAVALNVPALTFAVVTVAHAAVTPHAERIHNPQAARAPPSFA